MASRRFAKVDREALRLERSDGAEYNAGNWSLELHWVVARRLCGSGKAQAVSIPEAVFVAKTGKEVYQLAKKQGLLDRLVWALRKKHRILVLGATGTGKTNLITSLTEWIPQVIDWMNRTEFEEHHRLKIAGNPFVFIDTPGQALHKPARVDAIRQAMAGRVEGIIDVVCYGYHEGRGKRSEAVTQDDRANPDYLEARRTTEIQGLNEWTPLLGGDRTAPWLLTVVTKADLWWDRHTDVLKYYESGEYVDALGDVRMLNRGVVPYCSVVHRFYGQVSVAGSFDDSVRNRMRRHLLETLISAVGRSDARRV